MENSNNCQVIAYNEVSQSEQYFCKLLADMKENLSQLIDRRIRKLGLTKAELAKRVGVSRTYITDLANGTGNTQSGQYRPRPEIIEKLAKNLEVELSEILTAIGYAPENVPPIPERIANAINFGTGKLLESDEIIIANLITSLKQKNAESGYEFAEVGVIKKIHKKEHPGKPPDKEGGIWLFRANRWIWMIKEAESTRHEDNE